MVIISPADHQLISEGSEERRKFIDNAISQVDNHYLDDLIYYNKLLTNRNALLKKFAESNTFDQEMMDVFDESLVQYADKIYQKRKTFTEEFIPLFNDIYQRLSSGMEEVKFIYESQLAENNLKDLLRDNIRKDLITQRSNYGIHKDDFTFIISDYPLKKFGSQGQQKSYLIALKLAHYAFLNLKKGYKPLLLLDDIFDKLDDSRIKKLLAMVSEDAFGQIFITDTERIRVEKIFEEIQVECRIFDIEKGNIINQQ